MRVFVSNWQNHNFCRHMKKSTFYIFLRDPDFANPYSSLQIHTDPYKSILVWMSKDLQIWVPQKKYKFFISSCVCSHYDSAWNQNRFKIKFSFRLSLVQMLLVGKMMWNSNFQPKPRNLSSTLRWHGVDGIKIGLELNFALG